MILKYMKSWLNKKQGKRISIQEAHKLASKVASETSTRIAKERKQEAEFLQQYWDGEEITEEESDLRMAQIEALQNKTKWH